jgi:signal peptidase II
MKSMRIYVFAIALMAGLDQLIKFLVRQYLTNHSYIEVIPNFIHLTYQENKGISFSFLADLPTMLRVPLLAGVSAIVIIGLSVYIYQKWESLLQFEKWGFVFILSGALGNLWDRAVRQQVTDYMYFHYYDTGFFVNNLADDLISIGFVLIVIAGFLKKDTNAVK